MSPDASEELARLASIAQYVQDSCEEIQGLLKVVAVVYWRPRSMCVVDPLMKALRAKGLQVSVNTVMLGVRRS